MSKHSPNQLLRAISQLDVLRVRQLINEGEPLFDLSVFCDTVRFVEPLEDGVSDEERKMHAALCRNQCAILSLMLGKHALTPSEQRNLFQDVFQQRRQDLFNVIYPRITSSVLGQWDPVEAHDQWNVMMQEAERFHTQKALTRSLKDATKDKAPSKSSKM